MKLTLLGPTYPYRGGVSQHTTLLCHYLRRFHPVDFISFRRQYPSLLFPGKTDKDPSRSFDRESCVYLLNPLNPMSWYTVLQKIIQTDPLILIVIWWVPFFAPPWWFITRELKKRTNIRIFFICHNILPHEGNMIWKILTKMTLGIPDGFAVHSQTDEKKLLQLRPGAKVYCLPIAPHPRIRPGKIKREEYRRQLGITHDIPVFLFFGFVRPYKGLDVLLEAMSLVLQTQDGHLLIVGEFWEPVDKYLNMIHRLGLNKNVTVVNKYIPNEELGQYFDSTDVVVLPYRSATQSGVPQLSISLGKPVIVTDVGGLPENVRNSHMGMVVPGGDAKSLADAMIQFIVEKKNRVTMVYGESEDQLPQEWQAMISAIEDFSYETKDRIGKD